MTEPDYRNRIREALKALTKREQMLLRDILKIEQDNLHLQRPRVRHDMRDLVREHIKTLPEEES